MFKYFAMLLLMGTVASVSHAQTPVTIPLNNAGFESPSLSPSNSWYSSVNGWAISGFPGTTYNITAASPYPNTEGNQYLYGAASGIVDPQNQIYTFGFEIFQGAGTLDVATTYKMTFDVYPFSGQTNRLLALIETTNGVTMGEESYALPWNPDENSVDLVQGQWQTVTVEFNSLDFESYYGNNIQVRLRGDQLAIDNVQLTKQAMSFNSAAQSFYVSNSGGSDSNNGLSSATPWKTFSKLENILLGPGDKVFLKRGDTWDEELHLRGDGSAANPIELGSYGSGALPLIQRSNKLEDKCVIIESPDHWRIRDIDGRTAKLGLYLRYYDDYLNSNVIVENCYFSDMDSWDVRTEDTKYEYSFNAAIFVGGRIGSTNQYTNVLNGLTIQNCGFENTTAGFLTNWYFPDRFKGRLTNLVIDDVYSTQVSAGGLMLNNVDGATVTNFRTFGYCGQAGSFSWGSTGGILSATKNILIEDSAFTETDRMWPDQTEGDGCGFDIDGDNENITIRNTVFANNEGPGLLFLATNGLINDNIIIEDCTFYNNGLDAATTFNGNAYSIKATNSTIGSATFRNLGLYRSAVSWDWIYPNAPQNTTLQNIDYNYYSPKPLANWEFNTAGDFEGWNTFNQWNNPVVTGGTLRGTSTGNDPFTISPDIWVAKQLESSIVTIRMKATAGSQGLLFFQTERDQTWTIGKAVSFPVVADNTYRTYNVDLSASPEYKGLITKLRVDPVETSSSTFRVNFIRWQ